jgi:drug/metabolite transporter (DMT)-like permease
LENTKNKNHYKPLLAVLIFTLFCVLSALRDSLSEILFKGVDQQVHPAFSLFVYSVVTQIVSLAWIWGRKRKNTVTLELKDRVKPLFMLNVYTLIAFLCYFLAIGSKLGAGLNAFIEYGAAAFFVAILAVIYFKEKVDIYYWSIFLALSFGLSFFVFEKLSMPFDEQWFTGLLYALGSAFASAMYLIYYKVLLESGMGKPEIILFRLMGITLILGVYIAYNPAVASAGYLMELVVLGVFGFALPLFLIIYLVEILAVRHLGLYLFAAPAMTYYFSWSLGYVDLRMLDLVGAAIIFSALLVNEVKTAKAAVE